MNIFRFKNLLLYVLLGATGIVTAEESVATMSLISPDTSITTIRADYEKPIVQAILTKVPEKKHPSQLATLFNHYWATHAQVLKDWYVGAQKRSLTPEEKQMLSLIEEITLKEWTFEAFNCDSEASIPFIASSVNLFDAVDQRGTPLFRTNLTTGMLDVFALNTAKTQKQATAIMNRLVKNLQEQPKSTDYQADINTLAAGLPEFKLNELPWLNARKAATIAGAITVAATTAFCGKKVYDYAKAPRIPTPPTPAATPPIPPAAPTPAGAPAPGETLAPMEIRAQAGAVARALGNVEGPTRVEQLFSSVLNNKLVPRIRREAQDLVHVTPILVSAVAGEIQNGVESFVTDPESVTAATTTGLRWASNAMPYYIANLFLGVPGMALMGASDAMSAARGRIQDPAAIPVLPLAPAPTAEARTAYNQQVATHTAIVTRNNQLRSRFGVATLVADKTRIASCALAIGCTALNLIPSIVSYSTGSDVAYWMTLGTEIAVPAVLAVTHRGIIQAAWNRISALGLGGQTIGGFLGGVWDRLTDFTL